MRAGNLDRRIIIQSKTETRDGVGQPIKSWATLATVWAAVKPVRGREFFDAQAVHGEADTIFKIRWRSDVTVQMRISYDGNLYDIQAIKELGRHEGLEILAQAKVK